MITAQIKVLTPHQDSHKQGRMHLSKHTPLSLSHSPSLTRARARVGYLLSIVITTVPRCLYSIPTRGRKTRL